jgi:hypothetical protein
LQHTCRLCRRRKPPLCNKRQSAVVVLVPAVLAQGRLVRVAGAVPGWGRIRRRQALQASQGLRPVVVVVRRALAARVVAAVAVVVAAVN